MSVKKNIGNQSFVDLGAEIRKLRTDVLQCDQKTFARLLGVSQAIVSQWESGKYTPSPMALMAIGNLGGADRGFWYKHAGQEYADVGHVVEIYKRSHPDWEHGKHSSGIREIPLLRDSLAAGTPRAVDEHEIEALLTLPCQWFPPGGEIFAVKVSGDSMSPIIEDGYLVFIDTARKDQKKLVNKMVAARDRDGVTIKWLRKDLGHFMLVPHNVSQRHPVHILSTEHAIVGEVLRWLGQPRATKS